MSSLYVFEFFFTCPFKITSPFVDAYTLHIRNPCQQAPNKKLWLALEPPLLDTDGVFKLALKLSCSMYNCSTASLTFALSVVHSSTSCYIGCLSDSYTILDHASFVFVSQSIALSISYSMVSWNSSKWEVLHLCHSHAFLTHCCSSFRSATLVTYTIGGIIFTYPLSAVSYTSTSLSFSPNCYSRSS